MKELNIYFPYQDSSDDANCENMLYMRKAVDTKQRNSSLLENAS